MKAYNNMETGYINEGEFSIFPRYKILFLSLKLNKHVHVGNWKKVFRIFTRIEGEIHKFHRKPTSECDNVSAEWNSILRQQHPMS